jgi:hypothetical protein
MYFLAVLFVMAACKRRGPDVSGIVVKLEVQRFEKDFFALDTTDVAAGLSRLQKPYGSFLTDYLFNILGAGGLPPDSIALQVKSFLQAYRPVYADVRSRFPDFNTPFKEIRQGLQYARYYFPDSKLPERVITYVGPIEGFGNVLTTSGFAVGLQLYLGKEYAAYKDQSLVNVYPYYRSRRFEPEYISVNCFSNLVDDLYPDNYADQPLINQMIEQGKRLYVLDKLLPEKADTLKTGYTGKQLAGCYENEAIIWNFFVQSDILYSKNPEITRDYLNDGPNTLAISEQAPGDIGKFVGWQIVKKWMEEHSATSLPQLMQTGADVIFKEARYKPK